MSSGASVVSEHAEGAIVIIATPFELSRVLNQVLLPASQSMHAFDLKPYAVSVLNRTAAGTPWPVVATVINDLGSHAA